MEQTECWGPLFADAARTETSVVEIRDTLAEHRDLEHKTAADRRESERSSVSDRGEQ